MTSENHSRKFALVSSAVRDITREQAQQWGKFGEQHHPDGTSEKLYAAEAEHAKHRTNVMAKIGKVTWRDILMEEVFEALAEQEPEKLRPELVQVAAVCATWIEDIDSRSKE